MPLSTPTGRLFIALGICCAIATAEIAKAAPTIVASADTEGHVLPCQFCPGGAGNGGLARRATVLARMRASEPDLLLVDSGNALFGTDSAYSNGQVIITAYAALGYDAVNLSYRDFRSGKAATLALLKDAKVPVVSANLVNVDSGKPLFLPYVVKRVGGVRVAIIGVTSVPDTKLLPHLAEQLKEITVVLPADGLAQWLPRAKAESDKTILLYYGSASGLRPLLTRFGNQLSAVAVGGMQADELPAPMPGMPILLGQRHGTSLARAALGANSAEQIVVASDVEPDAKMAALAARFQPPPAAEPVVAAGGNSPAKVAPASPTAVATGANPPSATQPQPTEISKSPAAMKDIIASVPPKPEALKPNDVPAPDAPKSPAAASPAPRPHGQSRGLEGVGLTAIQVNAAIDKGAVALWDYCRKKDAAEGALFGDRQEDFLCALALVHAEAHKKIPAFDLALRSFLERVEPATSPARGTYTNGLLCMLIQAYGDPTFDRKLRQAARWLVEAQGSDGTWTYNINLPDAIFNQHASSGALQVSGGLAPGAVGESWQRLTPWPKDPTAGDNSNTQYALLGLQAAASSGIRLPADLWDKSLATARARQASISGGWDYHEAITDGGYGSMTAAGICAVAICRYQAGERDFVGDPAITRGLGWMDLNFDVSTHPRHGNNFVYYWLYSVERVGHMVGTDFIGIHEWYPEGAAWLVKQQQENGLWSGLEGQEKDDTRLPSSFALLFLTRATQPLKPVQKLGPGTLRTAALAPDNRFYIILDCSGSMLDNMEGRMKFDIARGSVQALIDALPPNSQAALRVYGHRKSALQPDCDLDTELKIPMGPLDNRKFTAALNSLRSRGKTPMALSIEDAIQDLGNVGAENPVTLLLLTDGGEDTIRPRGNPIKACQDLAKVKNVRFHIVGFDINEPDWSTQLQAMAQASGGRYWPAAKGADLERSVRNAVLGIPDQFTLLDGDGHSLKDGHFGDSIPLPEGKYSLRTAFAGRRFDQEFHISPQETTLISFDASQVPSGEAPADTAAPIATSPPPAPAAASQWPKFCTHCGAPLQPGQKFCTKCGTPVKAKT